ncbi:MAG: hydroxysqualene dehydroxylase HpnE [Gemmataceae bacterium]
MTRPRVAIIGGGLAGLAAATALAPRGYRVILLESRDRLGGRAGSFTDPVTGQLIDACQHVSMGCCTNYSHFCKTLGIAGYLEPQPELWFMTPDRKLTRFRADDLPAPLHLARSFANAHYLTLGEKLRAGYALAMLRLASTKDDPPFQDWLVRHYQTQRIIDRFWGLVLVSALNETPDRIGLRYARKVFVDGFLTHPRGFVVDLPTVPLGRLYGNEMRQWLSQHQVEVHPLTGVKQIVLETPQAQGRPKEAPGMQTENSLQLTIPESQELAGARPWDCGDVVRLELRTGEITEADWYISTVPFDRLLDLLPTDVIERKPYFANLRNLTVSPITSVHCWFDKSATHLPHVTLIDSVGQWVFNRGKNEQGEYYLQVVVSAARQFRGLGREEVQRQVVEELRKLFPPLIDAKLLRAKVVTEHAATFSAVPGVDRWRPPQGSPIRNLLVAGDWTATGWPATMEGAVRSGYLAAEELLRRDGKPHRLLQPDL